MKPKLFLVLVTLIFSGCSPQASQPVSEPAPSEPPTLTPERATTAATSQPAPQSAISSGAKLQDFGPAPELTNEIWLNTAEPLRLEDLRGKVVLLDMWTFG